MRWTQVRVSSNLTHRIFGGSLRGSCDMLVSRCCLKQSGSSSRWIARQARDPFVRERAATAGSAGSADATAAPISFRSRSAFKLVSLVRKYPQLVAPGKVIVDLGAAPGGWSQVAAQMTKGHGSVWALDILGMDAIDGVHVLKGDFLKYSVQEKLRSGILASRAAPEPLNNGALPADGAEISPEALVDTVLSDMMAPMSGLRIRDIQASLDLVAAATYFAKTMLRSRQDEKGGGGNLVLKYFAHPDLDAFRREELEPFFRRVVIDKPKGSRSESSEAYWVCLGYKGTGTAKA